ncbi:sensor histidine kinase [Sphingomonas sp. MMS12-HWE2-04]|uniref:sensor histidine kinase n=1 Tax=Sphingomonas sp. MMS12-HWE2-04 TaxID=3234199 RepID=UPI00384AD660
MLGAAWTESRRQQAALHEAGVEQAHLSRLSTLGAASAVLAHELGQPLSAIGMGAATALRLLGKDQVDLAAVRRLCERIVAQSTRAADIIDRVQGMAAKRDPLTTPLALADLLDEAVRFVRHELDREAIVLRLPTLSSLGLVDVDRVQLQQVLVNLLMNAIQALRRAETSAPEISIGATRAGDRIRIEIQDNGPGIPPELHERIFEEFFTTRPEGLGLGLRICRSIVDAHGGTIEAQERDDGTGARFVVTLPAAR